MSEKKSEDIDSEDNVCPEYGNFTQATFDYTSFFERIGAGEGSVKDHEEFTARAMQMFCLQVWSNNKPDEWLLLYFADQFMKVLNGGKWCDELPLPWLPQTEVWTLAEKRGLNIYCYIENIRRSNPDSKMDSLFSESADKFNVSWQHARDEYYRWRNRIK